MTKNEIRKYIRCAWHGCYLMEWGVTNRTDFIVKYSLHLFFGAYKVGVRNGNAVKHVLELPYYLKGKKDIEAMIGNIERDENRLIMKGIQDGTYRKGMTHNIDANIVNRICEYVFEGLSEYYLAGINGFTITKNNISNK